MNAVILEEGGLLKFWCPGCDSVHRVRIDHRIGWNNNPHKPTLPQSLLLWLDLVGGPVQCHSMISEGNIRFLPDSIHNMAGQTVRLPPFPEGH